MNLKESFEKKILRNAIHIVVIIALYFIIFNYVSQKDIISGLLTAGNQTSKLDMILSISFITLRFFTLVLLPGIIFAMAGSIMIEYIEKKKHLNPALPVNK